MHGEIFTKKPCPQDRSGGGVCLYRMCFSGAACGRHDHIVYDCKWYTGNLSGGDQGDVVFGYLEAGGAGSFLWDSICDPDFDYRYAACSAYWRAGGAFDGCFSGGDSAGAALAALICNRYKLEGLNRPCVQMLVYPVTDAAMQAVRPAVELLAGIPSVVYGLLGMMILNPVIYRLEQRIFAGSKTHQFTGGANLLSAVLVLAVMILPTVISISESALRSVPSQLRECSLALGASRIQTIFQVVIPAARPGIVTAVVLGVGRAVGEAMAVSLVSGGSVNFPLPFCSVRFLTTALVSEMAYANGLHRQVLFTVGMVLFLFIMAVNLVLHAILRKT